MSVDTVETAVVVGHDLDETCFWPAIEERILENFEIYTPLGPGAQMLFEQK